jgi:hypothetical protein
LWLDGPPPSLAALCDALVWREHGLASKPKRCPPELRAVYVQRRLGSEAGAPERGVRLLAAREVGAPRPELRALRDALVRGWLAGRALGPPRAPEATRGSVEDAPVRGGPASAEDRAPRAPEVTRGIVEPAPDRGVAPSDEPAEPAPAASFAGDALRAAAAVTEGRFGDRKVFVSAAWDELRRDPRWSELALAEFKARLVAAHRAGELALARADLVAAMDPALVAASEIAVDGASFHFIVLKEPAP